MSPAVAAKLDLAIALRQLALDLKQRARRLEIIPARSEAARDLFRRANQAWAEAEELLTDAGLR